jgi:hypothetical protein
MHYGSEISSRIFRRLSFLAILLFVFWPSCLRAQEATTSRNVILRRDPTTSSPPLEHLSKGTRLTLVDAKFGWVFWKYVSISAAETPATPATPSTTPSMECDPSISAHVYHPNRLIGEAGMYCSNGDNRGCHDNTIQTLNRWNPTRT